MYFSLLKQELLGRKRQTITVALGLAVAIALVIVVSSLSTGIKQAQSQALENIYGIGTDLTVTGAAEMPGQGRGGPRFEFGQSDGTTAEGTTTLSQSVLMAQLGRGTLGRSAVDIVADLNGVARTTGVLELINTSFTGELPDFSQLQQGNGVPGDVGIPDEEGGPGGGGSFSGPDGSGGSAFGIETFTVMGVDPAETAVGPLSAVTVTSGRGLAATDVGQLVALLDQTYAESYDLAVGDAAEVGGREVEVVGVVASATDAADTAANLYLPLDTARTLAEMEDVVSTVYVSATSASSIDAVQSEIAAALPDAVINSQSELAEQVSGSLSSASGLISNLGTWLSIVVLAVALLIAMLLTSSGVSRRIREFGTLKAIGWSNGRVVSQVAGESMVQAIIGGIAGLTLGLSIIGIINLAKPTISSAPAATGLPGGVGGPVQGAFPQVPGGQGVADSRLVSGNPRA